jgi:hypothetical protein
VGQLAKTKVQPQPSVRLTFRPLLNVTPRLYEPIATLQLARMAVRLRSRHQNYFLGPGALVE